MQSAQSQEKQPMAPTTTPSQPMTSTRKGVTSSSNVTRKSVTIPPSNNPYIRHGPKNCFKCNQPRHRSHQCPRRKMVNLIKAETSKGEDGAIGDKPTRYEQVELVDADEGVPLS
jgi:hypothetical protein